jgi:hypothetical protein
LACGIWYSPSLIMAPLANALAPPVDEKCIDPWSSGEPSSVTFPSTANRSLRLRQPTRETTISKPTITQVPR